MDENATAKHNHAIDRMFEVANERAQEVSNRLIERGVTPDFLEAFSLFLSQSLDRNGDPDAAIRLEHATIATIESEIGSHISRIRATKIGRVVTIKSLQTARRVILNEEAFGSE